MNVIFRILVFLHYINNHIMQANAIIKQGQIMSLPYPVLQRKMSSRISKDTNLSQYSQASYNQNIRTNLQPKYITKKLSLAQKIQKDVFSSESLVNTKIDYQDHKYVGKYFHHKKSKSTIQVNNKSDSLSLTLNKSGSKSLKKYGQDWSVQHNTQLVRILEQKSKLLKVTGKKKSSNKQENMVVITRNDEQSDSSKALNISKFLHQQKYIVRNKLDKNNQTIESIKQQQQKSKNLHNQFLNKNRRKNQQFKTMNILNKTILLQPHDYYDNQDNKNKSTTNQFGVTANKAFIGAKKINRQESSFRKQYLSHIKNPLSSANDSNDLNQQKKQRSFPELFAKQENSQNSKVIINQYSSHRAIKNGRNKGKRQALPQIRGWDVDQQLIA